MDGEVGIKSKIRSTKKSALIPKLLLPSLTIKLELRNNRGAKESSNPIAPMNKSQTSPSPTLLLQ